MSKIPTPPKPTYINAEETYISIEFTPDPSAHSYDLCWKLIQQSWDDVQSNSLFYINLPTNKSSTTIQAKAVDLQPGCTYCLRIIAKDASGNPCSDPSPELIVDSEGVSCAPKSKSCCVIQ